MDCASTRGRHLAGWLWLLLVVVLLLPACSDPAYEDIDALADQTNGGDGTIEDIGDDTGEDTGSDPNESDGEVGADSGEDPDSDSSTDSSADTPEDAPSDAGDGGEQADSDTGDAGEGDAADAADLADAACPDDDGDGVCNAADICALGPDDEDDDADGVPDDCDVCDGHRDSLDDDGDDVPDGCDACPGADDADDEDDDQIPDACDCDDADVCHADAYCTPGDGEQVECTCNAGFEGDGQDTCDDINECDDTPCALNTDCENIDGGYICRCITGYESDDPFSIGCNDIDECTDGPGCAGNTDCDDTDGSYTCSCIGGYESTDPVLIDCTDIDECTDGPGCADGAQCDDTDGSYDCACSDGYESIDPFTVGCTDIDECVDGPGCAALTNCDDTDGGYTCTCQFGYQSIDPYTLACTDIDECGEAGPGCAALANCQNNEPGHTCVCPDGYESDDPFTIACTDTNECDEGGLGCAQNADCENAEPGHTCTCQDGYASEDPYNSDCTDIDECQTGDDNCDDFADCDGDTPVGSFTCACPEGYGGDGTVDDPCRAIVNIQLEGSGGGRIRDLTGEVLCSPMTSPCELSFDPGAAVTFTGSANPGSSFAGWGHPSCDGVLPCTLALEASPITLTPSFTHDTNLIFVTEGQVPTGALGETPAEALAAADAFCQSEAERADLPGTYMAWLSNSSNDAVERIRLSRETEPSGWLRMDGRAFIGSLGDLTTGPIYYPVRFDQFGSESSDKYLTGTLADGTRQADTCDDYTSTDASARGGSPVDGSDGWTASWGSACNGNAALLCMGNNHAADVTPVVHSGRPVFLSREPLTMAGPAEPDQVCSDEAREVGLSGIYRALIATGGQGPAQHAFGSSGEDIDYPSGPWITPDGRLVSDSDDGLVFGETVAAISVDAAGASNSDTFVWTGATPDDLEFGVNNNCSDWSTTDGDTYGRVGIAGSLASASRMHWTQTSCDRSQNVTCAQIPCREGVCGPNAECAQDEGVDVCACPDDSAFWVSDNPQVDGCEFDECAAGTHNCDDLATCNGLEPSGSFTCTCPEGYGGPGTTDDPCTVSLTITVAGSGTGTVSSDGAGVVCTTATSPCEIQLSPEATETLTATPSVGSTFATWDFPGCQASEAQCAIPATSSPLSATVSFTHENNLIFATEGEIARGAMGATAQEALAAADAFCQSEADRGGLPGTYVAWLSNSSNDAVDRIRTANETEPSGWIRMDGRAFTGTLDELISGIVYYPVRFDQFGAPANSYLTGTDVDGTAGTRNCGDYTDPDAQVTGGVAVRGHWAWTEGFVSGCTGTAALLCMGVDLSTSVTPQVFEGRRAFLSRADLTMGGADAPDRLCAQEARDAGLGGVYRALIAVSGQGPAEHAFGATGPDITYPPGPWVTPAGRLLSENDDGLIFGETAASLDSDAQGQPVVSPEAWTGATAGDLEFGTRLNCSNWSNDSTEEGTVGRVGEVIATRMVLTDRTCEGGHGVVCVEVPCREGICGPNAVCAEDGGTSVCGCPDGFWVGDDPQFDGCEFDECAAGTDECDDFATCDGLSPAGSYTCTCPEGYGGAGTTDDPCVSRVTINFDGTGGGAVRNGAGGIVCTSATAPCVVEIPAGTSVGLGAEHAVGSIFTRWSTPACVPSGLFCLFNTEIPEISVTVTFQALANLVFSTEGTVVAGALGGSEAEALTAADAFCQSEAERAGRPGTYMAWLSTTGAGAADRLRAARDPDPQGWLRMDGRVFADTIDGVVASAPYYPVRFDQFGNPHDEYTATGTLSDGQLHTGRNCDDFTSNDPEGFLAAGSSDQGDRGWTNSSSQRCDDELSLVCFGTDLSAPQTPWVHSGRRVFYSGDSLVLTGPDSPDRLCAQQALAAGLPGIYRAMVAVGDEGIGEHVFGVDGDAINYPGGPWVTPDARLVTESGSGILLEESLAALSVTAGGTRLSDWARPWSGTVLHFGDPEFDVGPNCGDWSDTGETGVNGLAGSVNANNRFSQITSDCTSSNGVLCAEIPCRDEICAENAACDAGACVCPGGTSSADPYFEPCVPDD